MQTGHGPGHVDFNFLLALQAVRDVGALGGVAAALQIVTEVPSAIAAVLYAQPASL